MVETWTSNMEKGLLNGVVLLDLRKAFDLVDTDILLDKLSFYQCDDRTLQWFKSYLQGREQCVLFKGQLSDTKPVTHGVPQGSILGPLLFICFMNDLPFHVDSPMDMYADDSTIHATGETIQEVEHKLNVDLKHVQEWCQINRMAVNAEKTKVMLITTYQKETRLQSSNINVNFNETSLENVASEKLLGVVIDKHLTWKSHIDKTAKTLSRNLALFRRIKKYLPHDTCMTFYQSFIQPHIDYCSTIWGQSPHISRIHILQKMALRLIMDVNRMTPSLPIFKFCEILPVQERVKYRTVIQVYKSLHELAPSYMTDMFTYQSEVSKRTTRFSLKNKLHVPRRNLCVSRRSISYNGATEFNKLPSHIQDCNTLSSFKCQVFKHYLQSL